ncbi:transient receptor potential cation channel subfamily M member 1-like isoform X3 [Dreissena polymorpha]|uniref:transient receptor potential cation channel subfamily M member 1-like isoform X3 n=1 Tax=Dreissena polymorpha TaxID=45954 RepID=UPI002264F857|nr:transient receptor potential cation channel subfamily M member 1-like isoform X3 [Dreissena polymorpha]
MGTSLPFWNYMLLWALVLEQQEVAKLCLQKVERATAMTLIASDFYADLSKKWKNISREDEMQNEWTNISKGIIDVSYSDDKKKTASMLLQKLPYWDNNSCIELAFHSAKQDIIARDNNSCIDLAKHSKKYDIIAHPACQKAFDSFWEMGLHGKKSSIMFAMCIIFPVLAGLLKFNSTDSVKEKIRTFFYMSKTKFIYTMIWYFAFLILFAYVLVFDLGDTVTTTQYVLLAWVVTMLLEEIRQMARSHRQYFTNGWNVLDIITIVLFSIGFGLRFTDMLNAARVLLAIDFVAFVLRLNHIFYVHNILGPKLKMIRQMFQDLLYFLVIMAVFFFSYAISSYAVLYPDSPFTWETVKQILRRPYWHLYGELFLEETEGLTDCTHDSVLWTNGTYPRCPSETGKIVVPIMMAIYLLVANILLLNLLIAMFSFTFNELNKDSNSHWCFQRYDVFNEYADRPVLCPPLNVFWLLHLFVNRRKSSEKKNDPFRVSLDDRKMEDIIEFEKAEVEKYLNSQKLKDSESTDGRIKTTNEILQDMNKRMDIMQTQMKKLILCTPLHMVKQYCDNLSFKIT